VFSLTELIAELDMVKVIDVGAAAIDGEPPYQPLVDRRCAELVGFEPAKDQLEQLLLNGPDNATFLPHAIGDGTDGVLKLCKAPGMTSLLEPDQEILRHFHSFDQWGQVVDRQPVTTHRLDDIDETLGMDYLKVDVQGGELGVFSGASQRLDEAVVVHTEVQFVPFYKEQPLFAELDQALRARGYFLHRFLPLISRTFQPMLVNNDPYAGLSQVLWSDAVYVRRFTDFETLPGPALLKIALISHDLYDSYDLTLLALTRHDERFGTQYQPVYLQALAQALSAGPNG